MSRMLNFIACILLSAFPHDSIQAGQGTCTCLEYPSVQVQGKDLRVAKTFPAGAVIDVFDTATPDKNGHTSGGMGFFTSNGTITVSQPGLFMIYAQLRTYADRYNLVINGKDVLMAVSPERGSTVTLQATYQLNKGDTLWLKARDRITIYQANVLNMFGAHKL